MVEARPTAYPANVTSVVEPNSKLRVLFARYAAGVAAVSAIVGLMATVAPYLVGVWDASAWRTRSREQAIVEQLHPGKDYAKYIEILDAQPDYHVEVLGGDVMYRFDREFEVVTLLVHDGYVLSVGIYLQDLSFQPVVDLDSLRIHLGRPLSAARRLYRDNPIPVQLACGAGYSAYSEQLNGDRTTGFRAAALGVSTDLAGPESAIRLCEMAAIGGEICRSDIDKEFVLESYNVKNFDCLSSIDPDFFTRDGLPLSRVILAAPGASLNGEMDVIPIGTGGRMGDGPLVKLGTRCDPAQVRPRLPSTPAPFATRHNRIDCRGGTAARVGDI